MTETATRPNAHHIRSLTRAEDVLWLVVEGREEPGRAAARVGTTLPAVQMALARVGRQADWAKIAAAKPAPVTRSV